jgi:hypothetical protein
MGSKSKWAGARMIRAGKPARRRPVTAGPAPVTGRTVRRGAPRDMAGLSAGNPFADSTQRGTGYDDTPAGYTDYRSHVPPTYEITIPHRVSAWPDSTPSSSARAATFRH